jgi:hypothetical protein
MSTTVNVFASRPGSGATRNRALVATVTLALALSCLVVECVETKLKNAVCRGQITLSSARSAIRTNWTIALQVTGIG